MSKAEFCPFFTPAKSNRLRFRFISLNWNALFCFFGKKAFLPDFTFTIRSVLSLSKTLSQPWQTWRKLLQTTPPQTLPPLPGAAPLVHIPGAGDGKNWRCGGSNFAAPAMLDEDVSAD